LLDRSQLVGRRDAHPRHGDPGDRRDSGGAPRGGWTPAGIGGRAGRWSLRLVAHLSPELDHLFLKVDHSLGAHGCQSNEFHDCRPYPAVAGKGFVELGEPVEEFPSDNGFGIELRRAFRAPLLARQNSSILTGGSSARVCVG
jgi:hypothetical protein